LNGGKIGPEDFGCIQNEDAVDPNANPNDCKNLVARDFTIKDADINKIHKVYGEFL